MADCIVFTDCYVSIDSNDVSDRVHSVELPLRADEIDCSAFGSSWKSKKAGATDAQVTIEFKQKFGTGEIDAILYAAFVAGSSTVLIKPTSASVSASNPSLSASYAVTEYTPISGRWGEKLTSRFSWPSDGTVTRATS